ncbi:hypothetical protein F4553_000556 [Allocatelliglobosispora scoriae]|uniref:Alpha-L-arabinofuranosidase B arabinose-binding domain-containing protein n=1 Tax=Allocatelliglobosispora scoriae TaxID=643052 RepID=A0A841BDJ6_9ACTN|nr:AbfB domain-containing protein [Allocatelliglobosispora scoriae]MBB5867177.1 hypothetical protein [Allocatelliglobosispora scoriae]
MQISLQSFNFSDRFVRHMGQLGELTPITSDLDRRDATFRLIDGLSDSRFVTFAASNLANHVLRQQGTRLRLDDKAAADSTFRADATFILTPGLADATAVSLRSVSQPDRFVRHRQFHLYVEQVVGDGDLMDATFTIASGFVS